MNSSDSAKKLTQTPITEHQREVCCSSPSAMCYWFTVSAIACGVLSLIGIYWSPLHGSSAATILFAAAIGCLANWFKNRTLHCSMTAPLFLIAAAVFLLSNIGLIHIEPRFVWPLVALGTGIAFVLEWRYGKQGAG